MARSDTQVAKLKDLAEQGHAVGQILLGSCYASGDGVEQDSAKAVAWYEKAAEKNVTTVAIIASTRNPLIIIAGLLGAILYTLQIPYL